MINNVTNLGTRASNAYHSATSKLRWLRHWRRSLLLAILAYVTVFVYIPDSLSSSNYDSIRILDASLNSSNFAIKFEVVATGDVIEARNDRQISDLHFMPEKLQREANRILLKNSRIAAGEIPGPMELPSARTSGFSLGNASTTAVITQINAWKPYWIYNVFGSFVVFLYLAVLIVGILSLLRAGYKAGYESKKGKLAYFSAGLLTFLYAVDIFFI